MANKEFKNIEEFIEGFTRCGPTTKDFKYDGIIFGMEFLYNGKYYRLTRDPIGNEEKLRKIFKKTDSAYIKLFQIPTDQYPDAGDIPFDCYLGLYNDINDLLDNATINGTLLKDIIVDEKTVILAID